MSLRDWIPALVALACVCCPLWAQSGGSLNSPVRVPAHHCPPVCEPEPDDPCCIPTKLTCTISHSVPVVTGIETPSEVTQSYECAQCFECCPCCPVRLPGEQPRTSDCCECWELPNKMCEFTISLSVTETLTLDISDPVDDAPEHSGFIRTLLESFHGATDGHEFEFDGSCDVEVSPCTKYADTAFIEYYPNKTVTITHTFFLGGVWGTDPDCATACPDDGDPFFTVGGCYVDTSTASGLQYITQSCGDDASVENCGE